MEKRGKNDPFELNEKQIAELIDLARFKPSDVFYDLGSGKGLVVLEVVRKTRVKKAIGIEKVRKYHDKARTAAASSLNKRQLERIDYWYGDLNADDDSGWYFYDLQDATVVFFGTDESDSTRDELRALFKKRHLTILTKNLPLVGYSSIASRNDPDCYLYLHSYPLKRIKRKTEWLRTVIPDGTLESVYKYYSKQIAKQYPGSRKYVKETLLTLMQLLNKRF